MGCNEYFIQEQFLGKSGAMHGNVSRTVVQANFAGIDVSLNYRVRRDATPGMQCCLDVIKLYIAKKD